MPSDMDRDFRDSLMPTTVVGLFDDSIVYPELVNPSPPRWLCWPSEGVTFSTLEGRGQEPFMV